MGTRPFSRIRCPRGPLRQSLTAEDYQAEFLIAYANPVGLREGKVVLDAVIGKDGIVQSLSVLRGDEELAAPALETVRHWAFRPLQVNGNPVEVATEIDVHFTSPQ